MTKKNTLVTVQKTIKLQLYIHGLTCPSLYTTFLLALSSFSNVFLSSKPILRTWENSSSSISWKSLIFWLKCWSPSESYINKWINQQLQKKLLTCCGVRVSKSAPCCPLEKISSSNRRLYPIALTSVKYCEYSFPNGPIEVASKVMTRPIESSKFLSFKFAKKNITLIMLNVKPLTFCKLILDNLDYKLKNSNNVKFNNVKCLTLNA